MAADGASKAPNDDIEAIRAQIATLQKDLHGLADLMGESASTRAGLARRRAGEEAERLGAEAARLQAEAENSIQRNPFVAILLFLGLGFLLGVAARR